MRALVLSLALLGAAVTPLSAQPIQEAPFEIAPPSDADAARARRDPFVRSDDACGASRYAHLVGEQFATLEQAALPAHAAVRRSGVNLTTLEYTPGKLNVVLDGAGRIAAIGCF